MTNNPASDTLVQSTKMEQDQDVFVGSDAGEFLANFPGIPALGARRLKYRNKEHVGVQVSEKMYIWACHLQFQHFLWVRATQRPHRCTTEAYPR